MTTTLQLTESRSLPLQPSASLESLTELNKALADSLRLQILRVLKNESFGVLELCYILEIRQPALSHHLKILAKSSLVSTRREGNSIFYRRAFLAEEDSHRDIKGSVLEHIDTLAIRSSSTKRIKQIQIERSQLSLSFFNKNANKFREKQGLIVEHSDYASPLHDVINGLGYSSEAVVLEVGPGEGQLLTELADKYKNLIALDNSSEMLEKSQRAIIEKKFKGVRFILGDTRIALEEKITADIIIFNMVLHHIPSPAKTFKDSAALLAPGGHLLIIDLSRHDQDWVRESCGDLWLGFDENDLNRWAEQAGLISGQNSYLGLRNGFQIQICIFKKIALSD